MHFPLSPFARPTLISLGAVAVLILAACSSDRPEGRPGGRAKPPAPLAGQELFFDGKIVAELKLGAGFSSSEEPREGGRGGGSDGRRGGGGMQLGGGMGGMSMGGGSRRSGGGEGGRGRRGGGDSNDSSSGRAEGRESGPGGIRPAGGPTVMIHIQLTNKSSDQLIVSATDFSSVLGNFVVLPEKLIIDPGLSAEFEPMTSRLGGDFGEVSVTLTLSVAGRQEKKTITLRSLAPPVSSPGPESHPKE